MFGFIDVAAEKYADTKHRQCNVNLNASFSNFKVEDTDAEGKAFDQEQGNYYAIESLVDINAIV